MLLASALLLLCHLCNGKSNNLVVRMPNVTVQHDDDYLCSSTSVYDKLKVPGYITLFVPDAHANKAHHVLVHTCNRLPRAQNNVWECAHHRVCEDSAQLIYAWAKDAPTTKLPEDVGFLLDPAKAKYVVIQVHYLHSSDEPDTTGVSLVYQNEPTKHLAGIYLLVRSQLRIPARTEQVDGNMNCQVRSTMYPFAFRTHTHKWGTEVSGFKYSPETMTYTEIARGSPQRAQTFYPVLKETAVNPGDFLVAKCRFNTTENPKTTYIGSTSHDEMCNLYLMYYTENSAKANFEVCVDEQSVDISRNMPDSSKSEVEEEEEDNQHRVSDTSGEVQSFLLQMPGARATKDDSYRCTAFSARQLSMRQDMYITKFRAEATATKAHHIILQKCNKPPQQPGKIWDCIHHATCHGESRILYAWAKDAPATSLPDNVGFTVHPNDYLVMQVHYAHKSDERDHSGIEIVATTEKQKFSAGIYLLWKNALPLPPHVAKINGDMNCKVSGLKNTLTLFAFRPHAHGLSTRITGYRKRNGQVIQIADGDPQKPQTFYPMEQTDIRNGDYLAARCTYDTSRKDTFTRIGPTAGDEMCNLYFMYYTLNDDQSFLLCSNQDDPSLSTEMSSILANSDKEVPMDYSNNHAIPISGMMDPKKKKQYGKNPKSLNVNNKDLVYTTVDWPLPETQTQLGQVSGVALDVYGNVIVFHRGDRVWGADTFKSNNEYNGDRNKPIPQNTILTIDSSGAIINAWGANIFFLPHMITVDPDNNIWVTDVAMHQVFKFAPYGGKDFKPLIALGKKFEPGNDDLHYCKPTSVAVMSDSRTFFVADGYCNSRIIKYKIQSVGANNYHSVTNVLVWGKANGAGFSVSRSPYSLNVPHSLVLAEDKSLICVADRENGRVQCYNTESGKIAKSIRPPEFGRSIYGVSYSPVNGGQLYAVGGPEPFGLINGKKTQGYIIDINSGELLNTFNDGLQNPHDVAVSANGTFLYVIELRPFKIWKMTNGKAPIPPLKTFPAVPTSNVNQGQQQYNGIPIQKSLDNLQKIIPTTGVGVIIVFTSVGLSCLLFLCFSIRRCRKRGRGKVVKLSKKDKKLDLGDLLGRSKDGFQPLNTDDDNDVASVSSDSDIEEFSLPMT